MSSGASQKIITEMKMKDENKFRVRIYFPRIDKKATGMADNASPANFSDASTFNKPQGAIK